ncbi:hypothetical protein PV327_011501, partial [Microctonus hyperodae]
MTTLFDTLPVELKRHILSYCDTVTDGYNLKRITKIPCVQLFHNSIQQQQQQQYSSAARIMLIKRHNLLQEMIENEGKLYTNLHLRWPTSRQASTRRSASTNDDDDNDDVRAAELWAATNTHQVFFCNDLILIYHVSSRKCLYSIYFLPANFVKTACFIDDTHCSIWLVVWWKKYNDNRPYYMDLKKIIFSKQQWNCIVTDDDDDNIYVEEQTHGFGLDIVATLSSQMDQFHFFLENDVLYVAVCNNIIVITCVSNDLLLIEMRQYYDNTTVAPPNFVASGIVLPQLKNNLASIINDLFLDTLPFMKRTVQECQSQYKQLYYAFIFDNHLYLFDEKRKGAVF